MIVRCFVDSDNGAGELWRKQLDEVLLRRTQQKLLRKLLPERTDYEIYCCMTEDQCLLYDSAAADALR